MIYMIADPHFFHENIVRLNPLKRKPGFEEEIISNLNSRLKPEDTLFVLGDFLWNFREDFLPVWKSLPGRKVLVKGNHDFWIPEE